MKGFNHFIFICWLVILLSIFNCCSYDENKDCLILKRSNFSNSIIYDTLEAYPERGLYILSLEHSGFLGHFSFNLGIIKQEPRSPDISIRYEMNFMNKSFRLSNEYITYLDVLDKSDYGLKYSKKNILNSVEKGFDNREFPTKIIIKPVKD